MSIEPRRAGLIAFLMLGGGALAFLDQAVHIDDANFLALARHAWPRPLQLYAFSINWGGTAEPAFDVLANPPGQPWLLALVASSAAAGERGYHLAQLPWLALLVLGCVRLARRFVPDPVAAGWAVLWIAAAPGLVVASHTLMPDLPLLACLTLGLALAVDGLDRDRPSRAGAGGLLLGLAALFRYSGAMGLGLLLLYAVLRRRPVRTALVALGLAAAPSLAWGLASLAVYGRVHALVIAGFQTETATPLALLHRFAYQLVALGLTMALPALVALVLAGPGRATTLGLLAGAVLGLAEAWRQDLSLASTLLLAAGAGGGVAVATLAFARLVRRVRDASDCDAVFLAAWLLGVVVFNMALRFASVRYLLLALPPAVLLVARETVAARRGAWRSGAGAAVGLTLALSLSQADARLADAYRGYVAALPPAEAARWFTGHWGLQHYLEKRGARALGPERHAELRPGDEIVAPTHAWPQPLPDRPLQRIEVAHVGAGLGLRTVSLEARACFHADHVAPGYTAVLLPFGFAAEPVETLTRWRVSE